MVFVLLLFGFLLFLVIKSWAFSSHFIMLLILSFNWGLEEIRFLIGGGLISAPAAAPRVHSALIAGEAAVRVEVLVISAVSVVVTCNLAYKVGVTIPLKILDIKYLTT